MRSLSLIFLLFCWQHVFAVESSTFNLQAIKPIISDQLSALDQQAQKNWQYDETSTRFDGDEEDVFVATYNPQQALNQGWTLLTVNTKAAKKKQKKKFYKQKKRQQDEESEGEDSMQDIVNLASLQLNRTSGDLVLLNFQPRFADFDQDAEASLQGTITFNKVTKKIVSITINAKQPFSPMVGVKMSRFFLEFMVDTHSEQFYIQQVRMQIQGRLAGLKKLSIQNHTVISNIKI